MRILHVLNHTMKLNGHVNAVVDLACAQSALGHRVSVARGHGDFDNILLKNSVQVIDLDQRRSPFSVIKAELLLLKIVKNFDIVHAHMVTSALLSYIPSKMRSVPLITTVHNEFQREAVLMGLGTRVIAVSNAVAISLEQRGISSRRLRTVLNGTIGTLRHQGASAPPLDLGSPSILFVGGLHPRKGLPDLISAFDMLYSKNIQCSLHIVGEGPYRKKYQLLANALPSSKSIFFHGEQMDPRPWFLGADIFVFPSHAEPAGLVLSEACEAGCAIVASKVGGIPEMLNDGAAGFLVPPKDPEQIYNCLLHLLSDKDALSDAKRRSLINSSRMTVERVVRETIEVYSDAIANM